MDEETPPPPSIVVDTSEPPAMLRLLEARGVDVERRRLEPADYVVGGIGLERKTVADFHASMIDTRLFEQLRRLSAAYETRALVLEGDAAFFQSRRNPASVWAALAVVGLEMGVPVLPTPDQEASADLFATLARRVGRASRSAGEGAHQVRFKPRRVGPGAEQRFAVQGLPHVGDILSDTLLDRFGSVREVFAAPERALLRVPGVGKKTAAEITEFLDRRYQGRHRRLDELE